MHAIAGRSPPWVRRTFGPLVDYADMLFVDHGIFRLVYLNRHRIAKQAWRSAQPAPRDIAAMARKGIRTIVNLRGERDCGAYRLQVAACRKHGIRMEELVVKSRAAPTREQVHEAQALFARIEHPILMHCKSGADRAGLASTLYLILHEGVPVEQAMAQLSARYGHFKQADTGIIDAFFQQLYRRIRAASDAVPAMGRHGLRSGGAGDGHSKPADGPTSSSTRSCAGSKESCDPQARESARRLADNYRTQM